MKVVHFIKNKYLLATVVFLVFIIFFDDRDLISNIRHKRELRNLEASREYYRSEISKTREELKQLRSDAGLLEKYAREKYLMKRDNEDLFLVREHK